MSTPFEYAEANRQRFFEEYLHLLRIPSISTQPDHAADVLRAAEWLQTMMLNIGMDKAEVILMPAGRCPLVLGEWQGAGESAATVLIYCHYDVQPAEVKDGWDTEPFEPTIQGERLYCRGAVDSKLHVMSQLKAVESLLAQEEKPKVNIKVILEGEEESGSENINAFIDHHPERLKADIAVLSDGFVLDRDQPSMMYGLRGTNSMELFVYGPSSDLHSGHWGGSVHNPIQALTEILAQMHDENGYVTVPGFYDDVVEMEAEERALLAKIEPAIQEEWKQVVDAPQPYGEIEYNTIERIGARPTLEFNGIYGGYTGDGFKTVLPAYALAKISCRLVPDQGPQETLQKIVDYIHQIAPPSVRVEIKPRAFGGAAIILDRNSIAMQSGRAAYTFGWGNDPLFERVGGSIPIAASIMKVVDQVVIMGYGLKSGHAHGPNENIYVDSFYKGINTAIKFIEEVGNRTR